MKIKYFGTGAAMNPNVDTTYFVISEGDKKLYVDAGAGQHLSQKIMRGEEQIEHLFMTHCHTDHLLGLAHVIRAVKTPITIYMSPALEHKLDALMDVVGMKSRYPKKKESGLITVQHISQKNPIDIYDRSLTPIDLNSKKDEQFGFHLISQNNSIVFFGDENVGVMDRDDLVKYMGCDWLLCEAFCSDATKDIFDPTPKAHITSLEVAHIASKLESKNVILSHIAESLNIPRENQVAEMKSEVASIYTGGIYIPMDGDVIDLG